MSLAVPAGSWSRKTTLVGDLVSGTIGGVLTTAFAVSYAALMAAGPLSPTQPASLVAMLTACLVSGLVTALLSSLPFAAGSPDGNCIVILAAMAGTLRLAMAPDASAAAMSATVLTMLALSALVIGAAMTVLGLLRAGRIVRFVPYQVMAGFLGATGWSLLLGGVAVGIGEPAGLGMLSDPDALAKLAATLAVGAAMFLLVPRLRHRFAVLGVIAVALIVHHGAAAALGLPLAVQTASGWLLNAPSALPITVPWGPSTLGLVDWHALLIASPGLLAAVLVALISLMLNVGAIELATARDADIDRELRAGGLASAAAGLLGGAPGYLTVSRSLALLQAGARTRLAPVVCAILAALVPLWHPDLLRLAPRPVLGGLLVYLGLQLVYQWAIRSRHRLSLPEWLTVLLVVGITIRFGFVVGVFAGLALGCVTFAIAYSGATPTRARFRGDVAVSSVSRPEQDRVLLHADGATRLVLHLHGFLFFGSANRLLEDVRGEVAATPGQLRFMVLDFHNVEGIDSSALSSFQRIGQIAAAERIVLIFTALPPGIATRLEALPVVAGVEPRLFPTLDQGLEWCEETRLAELRDASSPPEPPMLAQLTGSFETPQIAARFLARLEPFAVAAGTVLMRQGERSDELLFVETGRVAILVQFDGLTEVRARATGAGAMIGEIGFLLGEPRTATVRADTACRLLRMTRATLGQVERDDPELGIAFHRVLVQLLAHRLIDKDRMIAALMRGARQV